jgi:hypothetical protein
VADNHGQRKMKKGIYRLKRQKTRVRFQCLTIESFGMDRAAPR